MHAIGTYRNNCSTSFTQFYYVSFLVSVFYFLSVYGCIVAYTIYTFLGEHPAAMQRGCATNNINVSVFVYIVLFSLLLQHLNRILNTSLVGHPIGGDGGVGRSSVAFDSSADGCHEVTESISGVATSTTAAICIDKQRSDIDALRQQHGGIVRTR